MQQQCVSVALAVFITASSLFSTAQSDVIRASCVVANNSGVAPVAGVINITQPAAGGNVTLQIYMSGFNATTSLTTLHGFHVHENGNLSVQCSAALGHYNPFNVTHGAPSDTIRHVGDLGNVMADAKGVVNATIVDNIISLLPGIYSVVGRAIVVHSGQDDLGRSNETDSLTTGHAGARSGCCVINLDSNSTHVNTASTNSLPSLQITTFLLLLASTAAAAAAC